MYKLKMTLPKYLAFELGQKMDEKVLSVSYFEKDEANLIWSLEALYDQKLSDDDILALIPENDREEVEWSFSELEDKNWLEENRKSFSPIEVGSFYIHGSHITENIPTDKICIQLDASTAFGSGEHATTKGCLQAIEDLCDKRPFKKPMDMGCGTGILAFATASLLKTKVWAVDNDPEAVRKTAYNADIIGLADLIETNVSVGWSDVNETDFDLVIANILAGPLCDLAPHMKNNMETGGIIVLSGLLETQKNQVLGAYIQEGYQNVREYPIQEWTTLVMVKT